VRGYYADAKCIRLSAKLVQKDTTPARQRIAAEIFLARSFESKGSELMVISSVLDGLSMSAKDNKS
jgi:hypothetical protein